MSLALLSCTACHDRPQASLRAMTLAPPAMRSSTANRMQVVLALRSTDVLSCQTPSSALRHIQHRLSDRFDLVILAVGMRANFATDFLQVERLRGHAVSLTSREYAQTIGKASLPALYVIKGDTIINRWGQEWERPQKQSETLEHTLERLLAGRVSDAGHREVPCAVRAKPKRWSSSAACRH